MTVESLKILICDDSILARRQLKNFLETIGCKNIIEAVDGNSVVETYKQENPDLVFLDIIMPGKNGIQATKELIAYDKNAYIVIASSVGTQANLREVLELGAKDFIQKPLNTHQVQKIITSVLKGGI